MLRIKLATGVTIESDGDEYETGSYVRVVNRDGKEVGYWDKQEWADEPELVMGAFLNCAARCHQKKWRKP